MDFAPPSLNPAMTQIRLLALAFLALLTVGCKDSPTGPPPVTEVRILVPASSIIAGTSQTLTASAIGAKGEVLIGRTVQWVSSNTSAGTVSQTGTFAAVAPGSTTITATIEGKTASANVVVLPVPVASISIAAVPATVFAGTSVQLVAQPRDAADGALSGRTVTWSSSNTVIASISSDGLVNALTPGTVTITATSEGKSGVLSLTIAPQANAPIIASVTPSPMVPGTITTITGAGFEPVAANNVITVGGVQVTATSATATQVVFTAPCLITGATQVSVTSLSRVSVPVASAVANTPRSIAVGQALVVTSSAAAGCTELATGGGNARYLIAVFSASTSQNTLTSFEITGNPPVAGAVAPTARIVRNAAIASSTPSAEDARQQELDRNHFAHLERQRLSFESLRASMRSKPALMRRASAAALPVVGDTRDFFFTFTNGCQDVSRPMGTKAVYVGTRAIIWEDTTNVLLSTANTDLAGYYRRLGQIFDQDQYDALKDTFGDPLVRDTSTDNDGRIHMVYSQKLNGSGAAAYVTSCDQFPRTIAAGSNFGEVFYGSVPTIAGSNVNSTSFPDGWFYFMGRTVVHEVKHIVSIATRVQNNAPGESSWLEEGTARHAEEIWVRKYLHKVPWKGNTGFGDASTNGIYCDFHPSDVNCNGADPFRRPSYGMRRQFNEIRDKLIAPWDWSPYGDGAGQTGSVFYQTAWSLVRYTIDRYAASDADFFKRLIGSSVSGTTNLAATAGVSLDQLIGGWGLALYADDYPGLTGASDDLKFQTWNLRNIYAGLNSSPSWSTRFPIAFPIVPIQYGFGTFSLVQLGMRGGAHSYVELSGASVPRQLIAIRGLSGAAIPTTVRVAITRLQ